jgi:hypothetical protein
MRAPIIRAPTGGPSRRLFKWLGAFLLLVNGAFLVLLGTGALSHLDQLAQFGVGFLGGLLLILSGVELPWDVGWYRLAGLGYVCLAASFLFSSVLANDGLGWVAVTLVGALSLAFFGFDMIRGGHHFEIDVDADA